MEAAHVPVLRARHAGRGPQPGLPRVPGLRRVRPTTAPSPERAGCTLLGRRGVASSPRACGSRPTWPGPTDAPRDGARPSCSATGSRPASPAPPRPPRRSRSWPTASPRAGVAGARVHLPGGAASPRATSRSAAGSTTSHAAIAHLRTADRRPPASGWPGFGTGGALCDLRRRAADPRIKGVAALGAPADFDDWADHPRRLLEHARDIGLILDPASRRSLDAVVPRVPRHPRRRPAVAELRRRPAARRARHRRRVGARTSTPASSATPTARPSCASSPAPATAPPRPPRRRHPPRLARPPPATPEAADPGLGGLPERQARGPGQLSPAWSCRPSSWPSSIRGPWRRTPSSRCRRPSGARRRRTARRPPPSPAAARPCAWRAGR